MRLTVLLEAGGAGLSSKPEAGGLPSKPDSSKKPDHFDGSFQRSQRDQGNAAGAQKAVLERSRRPLDAFAANDDSDAAHILQAWDRARAAEEVRPPGHSEPGGLLGDVIGSVHDEEGLGHSTRKHQVQAGSEDLTRGLLTPGRHQHNSAQNARLRLTSTDGRRGFPSLDPSGVELSPVERVRRAKQRRNSYSVPQSQGLPLDMLPAAAPGSVSHQGAQPAPSDSGKSGRRLPPRRATLQNLQLDLARLTPSMPHNSGAQPSPSPASVAQPASPPASSGTAREPMAASSSGQQPNLAVTDGPGALEGTGIRRKIIKMISLQGRNKQRGTVTPAKAGTQAHLALEVPESVVAQPESDGEEDPAGSSTRAPVRQAAHDSDDEEVEEIRGSGTPAAPWKLGGAPGPSPTELRMMGAANSVSFKKSTMKQGVLRPLSTLPPFVPRLFIEDITLNHDKYRGFDAAGRDLTAASKTLQPSIIELQAAVMIADVTGFTKLTEILSKKGTSGVELLTTCMNNYFTRAINMIMAFEGDVVKFAGDSMIVLFYPNEHERKHADKGLRACTLRMMSCAHQLATKLGHMRMKMNGQVEPAPPPTPEPQPAPSAQTVPAPSAALPLSPIVGTSPVPLSEVEHVEGSQPDMLRNNSGAFGGTAAARRMGRDSPRSSTTNQAGAGGGGVDEASPSGTDAAPRGVDGAEAPQSVAARKRGKSWFMASLLKGHRGNPRRSDMHMTPGSMSPAGASSSGPSRGSFDKGEAKAATRMSARERAKTETGLGLTLRGSGGLVGGGGAGDGEGGSSGVGGLWMGEGVARRELSVATRLNLPPPLRPMQPRASATSLHGNAVPGAGATPGVASAPLASGVYPGSGSFLAGLANGTMSPTTASPRSFTEQAAPSGNSFRRGQFTGRSERRITASSLAAAGQAGDWRVKLQSLSTAIVQSPGAARSEEDPALTAQRSRLSETARAVRWDTVQEEGSVNEDEDEDEDMEGVEGDEDASYPPIQADAGTSASTGGQPLTRSRMSGPSVASTDFSITAPTVGERSHTSIGSSLGGGVRSPHVVDLRRKLLLRAGQADREDSHWRRTSGAVPREEGQNSSPGPVAEATEDSRSRGNSYVIDGIHGGDGKQGSFMSKVVNWFVANARSRGSYVDSFSNVAQLNPSAAAVGHGDQLEGQGSQPPSAPASTSNSFNHANGLVHGGFGMRVAPPAIGGGGAKKNDGTRSKDPIMEEVSNSRLSLKVMTSAGSVCVFHVGGGVDEVTDPTLPEIPRWEFFIGDRPLAPLLDANQRRRCISQVAAIEDQATAGSVVASIEVVELIQGEWELQPLPDSVWRVMGPAQVVPPVREGHIRLSHTSLRTSATSHTPHLRSSDALNAGSLHLQQLTEAPQTAEMPQAPEAMEELVSLQAMRLTSSATNGQPGAASSGQPSSGLVAMQRSLGNSLNGSDRPTNGSGAERLQANSHHHLQPQQHSILGVGSGRLAADCIGASDSMERANSAIAGAAQAAVAQLQSTSNGQLQPPSGPVQPASGPAPATPPAAAAAAGSGTASQGQGPLAGRPRHEFVHQPDHVQRRIAGLLRMHVLGSVRLRVEAGHLDFINEIRPLTCMFLGFPSLLEPRDDVAHKDQVECVQFAYTSVQAVMRKWDGSFLQFRSDEKGFVGICAFGLPGHTHEDNPTRGIRAALELASTIRGGGHSVAIGVTTGDLLCTCVGARKLRSEYTVFGDAINLSARLMVKSKKDPSLGEILCDEPTYLRAKYQASFIELEALTVKGKAQPVQVYRVGAHDATAEAQAAQQRREAAEVSSGERPLIGRDGEMTLTLNRAASMISGMSPGGIIVIEGNTGMGKTKLLMEVRKSLERINADTSMSSRPAFHMVFGMADTANKSQKLHPWRRVFQELFALDLKLKNMGVNSSQSVTVSASMLAQGSMSSNAAPPTMRRNATVSSASGHGGACTQSRRRGTEDGPGFATFTALGERLSLVPNYDTEWRQHLWELLDLPLCSIPLGSMEAELAQYAHAPPHSQSPGQAQGQGQDQPVGEGHEGAGPVAQLANGISQQHQIFLSTEPRDAVLPSSLGLSTPNGVMRGPAPWRTPSMRHSMTMPGPAPVLLDAAHAHGSAINIAAAAAVTQGLAETASQPHGAAPNGQVGAPIRKNSLNFLVHVMQEFISLYGPTLVLLENLHDFDTWSWQLLVKAVEVLTADCMILATTRPNDLPTVGSSHHLHGKAALYQKVAMMYRHLLNAPSALRIVLEPFNFTQTKSLMQVVADINYPDQYVLAVMEKTGGMPLYIEKVTEFLCQSQRPWLPDQSGEFSANVNKMIRNLNFQQVIIERMDRLKPGIHLTLKVASVMGQWVDLDILHKFYPINKSKEELRAHLQELERGNFLKPTDAEGVWEFNMVERDIVYEVIPHYQRRRLHAKLAQELEKSLEEQHVATLTTIAYHWNQACMGHEVTEVECSLKAIEFWHRAAEAAYGASSLMEALKLYQKAAQIAEVLAESMGDSVTVVNHHHSMAKGRDRPGEWTHSGSGHAGRDGEGGTAGTSTDGRIEGTDQSFTAVGSGFKGQLNWGLISRLSRSQWEKSMASCCLGIVLQHRYEFNSQLEYWDAEDYFRLLTEHAIRGLMLLGAPHPKELLNEKSATSGAAISRLWRCCCGAGSSAAEAQAFAAAGQHHGWHEGLILQDSEVQEIRDILLVLIIAAEHYSLQHDGGEYTRLLLFCKRVCKFFNKCSDSGTDPFLDIRSACSSRIKNFKASRAMQSTLDFGVSQEPALEAAAARNAAGGATVGPELSRAVLGLQRPIAYG